MYKCTLEKEGFIANYYEGSFETEKAIIIVGGAWCSEKTTLATADYLIKAGYNVLVLGFYLWKGLSKDMASIPVDYAEKAVHWLLEKPGIEKVAMTGPSTGGGYTLLCASLISEITCVIPVVPFDHVFEGITKDTKRKHCSTYTYHGEDIPYIPLELLEMGVKKWIKLARKEKGYGIKRFMRYGYDRMTPFLTEESRIKVENMNADVLLLSVKDDDCWPSDEAVPRIVKKLQSVGYPHRVDYHIYEKGSHALVDGLSGKHSSLKIMMRLMLHAEKKYPKECDEARQDSLKRILEFLKKW